MTYRKPVKRSWGSIVGTEPFTLQPTAVAIYGDSRTAQNSSEIAGVENYGYMFWTRFLSRQRVSYRHIHNFGVGGDTTEMMLARLNNVRNSPCGIVVILGSTNDRTGGMTAAQSIANLNYMVQELTQAGKWVVLVAETPRGDSVNTDKALTGQALQDHYAVRQWVLSQADRSGVMVADPWSEMIDPVSTLGYAKTGLFHDGLHPNANGAFFIGRAIARCIIALQPVTPIVTPLSTDTVGKWSNTNPLLTGTGGTPAAGGSGVMADSYTGANAGTAGGITRVYSKLSDGSQQIVIGGTAASGTAPSVDLMRQISLHTLVTAGQTIEAVADVELAQGSSNMMSLQLGFQVANADASTTYLWDGDRYSGTSVMPSKQLEGVLRTQPYTVQAGITDLRLRLTAYGVDNAAMSGTVIVRSIGMKVVS